ncbi:class I SAM-dependent methyltransferase [Xylophilus sp.]|uniref:class I SAM-dependent methyltransferase n=1 Tax=Xylophilus sp. TaxID=2653893 RepID=UPI0013B6A0E7|nr:class I SAM-dependent methyltransferase [Xylophilus sp.]KAF1049240.1 MAG: putative methyltransferase [Xylophilus sp.]
MVLDGDAGGTAGAVHGAARDGFRKEAQSYARGRPEYPSEAVGWLRDALGLAPGRTAVDVGAGTGKFTRLLAATGARVVAVEPIAQMREQLAQQLPGVEAVEGTAQAVPLADGAADVLACAQAFHWFATGEALAEFHRVLRPGGRLLLVWNVRDESVDWVARLTGIITPHEGDAPRFHTGAWRRVFDAPDGAGRRLFRPLEVTRWPHAHVGTPQQVIVDRVMSVSFIAALPAAENARVRAQIEELAATHPALRGRQEVSFPYSTLAFTAVRR